MTHPSDAHRPLNGFAVASLVFGIIGGAIFGVIFGLVALSQIKWREQRGRGLAIAGLVLSGIWALICAGGVALLIAQNPGAGTPRTVSYLGLKPGVCVDELTNWQDYYPKVSCSQPHDAEVFGVFYLDGADYPGEDVLNERVNAKCDALFTAYTNRKIGDGTLEKHGWAPSAEGWADGDRRAVCYVTAVSGKLPGPLNGR